LLRGGKHWKKPTLAERRRTSFRELKRHTDQYWRWEKKLNLLKVKMKESRQVTLANMAGSVYYVNEG